MTEPDGIRTITLEEHFATPAFLDGAGRRLKEPGRPDAQLLLRRLQDLGDGRIAEMDAAGIDVQVLSLTAPGTEQLPPDEARTLASEANAALAEAIGRHPDRFAGFAVLPTPDPERAAAELERAVRQLGFKGAVVNGHVGGRYLDDPFFWPVFERAEALGVPIYLHPTPPPEPVAATYYRGHFPPAVAEAFATHGWGWHIESALHVLRIVLGGVFDRYPRLQLIMGHLGETLPFMLERLEHTMPPGLTRLERPIGDYLRENVRYTFSGFTYLPPFLDLLLQVGADRILFSADYPFAEMADARAFLAGLPVSPRDRAAIAHGNAERLLRL